MITIENFEFAVNETVNDQGELVTRNIIIRESDSGLVLRFPLTAEHATLLADALSAPHIVVAQEIADQNGSHL